MTTTQGFSAMFAVASLGTVCNRVETRRAASTSPCSAQKRNGRQLPATGPIFSGMMP